MMRSRTEPLKDKEIADHLLYRTYWSIMLADALAFWKLPITEKNKLHVHELHKEILGYKGISGQSQEVVGLFLFEICVHYAVEYGVFIKTSKKQVKLEQDMGRKIENMALGELWDVL